MIVASVSLTPVGKISLLSVVVVVVVVLVVVLVVVVAVVVVVVVVAVVVWGSGARTLRDPYRCWMPHLSSLLILGGKSAKK